MKIRIHTPSGYSSLEDMDFPLVVEAHQIGENNAAHVKASIMRGHGCGETCDADYVFLDDEYTLVQEEESDSIDRKGLLIQLVQDYGVAINDGCYESECGSLQAMAQCHEEEKRLLAEIIKMIEEGV